MAFTTSNPFVDANGVAYDKLGVSLITSPGFGAAEVEGRVVLVLDPYRINEQGQVERPMVTVETEGGPVQMADTAAQRTVVMANAYAAAQSDAVLAQALGAIGAALQAFIAAKGL